jgi:uncharacterized membrane protein (UPF0127 family)
VTGRARGTAWLWVGVALAFLGIVGWFVVASVALDSGESSSGIAPLLRDGTPADAPFTGLTEIALGVGGDCWIVVVADDQRERVEGLRGRRDTGPYDGMLFVFDEPTTAAFTMSGVPVPLDIGFYDAGGAPVSRRRMEPCPRSEADCPVYRAEGEFAFALETEAGGLADGALGACPS